MVRKQTILDLDVRERFTDRRTQAPSDDELYREEKDIFRYAEAYRASVVIHEAGVLSPANIQEIRV
jgi:hypothetical protein